VKSLLNLCFIIVFSSHIHADTYSFTFDDNGFANMAEDSRYTGGLFFVWMSDVIIFSQKLQNSGTV
jgi:hypothetical protein